MSALPPSTPDHVRLRKLSEAILDLWAKGGKSTFCIAQELRADERDVCQIIQDAQECGPKGGRS